MKTATINNMLSVLAMIVMDVTTFEQIQSTQKVISEYVDRLKLALNEEVAIHFEILALKILSKKIEAL